MPKAARISEPEERPYFPSEETVLSDFELCWSIREFEERLLDLVSQGKIAGTTHTCRGQEISAVGVIKSLPPTATIFSNHRSHGHFLAATENYAGLLHEILGHESGVNFGIGGSQHLCVPGRFYSNGVLGGTIAMACGYAWGKTRLGQPDALSVVFLGDGGIGEGACYESFNMAKLRNLPVIFVVEDNGIAQSTLTSSTIAGTLEGRFAAFGIPVTRVSDGNIDSVRRYTEEAAKLCAEGKGPAAIIIDVPRLGPHSKGDDTRDADMMKALLASDPLESLAETIDDTQAETIKSRAQNKIKAIYDEAVEPGHMPALVKFSRDWYEAPLASDTSGETNIFAETMGARINQWLLTAMEHTPNMLVLGEDLLDPYGGAFKISKGLSSKFPDRVWSTPISEQAIIGYAGGASLAGAVPVAEIMFGDFVTLCCDAIVNYLSKFRLMYGGVVETPAIIRTAVGAGRGYGPTHSQSLERMLAGIPGLHIEAPNPLFDLERIYQRAVERPHPSFIIEHKTDYSLKFAPEETGNVFADFRFERRILSDEEIASASLTSGSGIALVAYGGLIKEAMKTARTLLIEHEIAVDVIAFHKLQPISRFPELLEPYATIFLMEEGPPHFGIMSEYEAKIRSIYPAKTVYRLTGKDTVIPNSKLIENDVVMNAGKAIAAIASIMDA